MPLTMVTLTGADESVDPSDLLELSREFPYVEFGILVSATRAGMPRFPGPSWIYALQDLALAHAPVLQLSLHLCGRYVQKLLGGHSIVPQKLLGCFHRVQLNFHAERVQGPYVPHAMQEALKPFVTRQIIFQIDGYMGNTYLQETTLLLDNHVPLYDASHGGGVLPPHWPQPLRGYLEHGYAGGLGSDNLETQIPRILSVARNAFLWIDMETNLRTGTPGGVMDTFDLAKARQCLELARPFVLTGRQEPPRGD